MSTEWMFEGFWYFWNEFGVKNFGLLPDVKIPDNMFNDIWGKMGVEIRSKFVIMLPVTPSYIVIHGNPEEMKIDEFKMTLPLHGYISAKRTSQESWQ